jgi:hypothetical protein
MNAQTELWREQSRHVLIIGPNRSGTTWLNQLLQAHREICGINKGETMLFRSLTEIWRDFSVADDSDQHLVSIALGRRVRSFCDELIDGAQARSSRPEALFFVEKTAGTALELPMLRYVFPDAWYIHILRDGRDVVRSMRRRGYMTSNDLANSYYWAQQENFAEKCLAQIDRVINIRYEDLHDDPLREICAIYARLGLDQYPGLAREIRNRCAEPVALYTREGSVGSGKWRRDVSRWRLASMYAGASDQLVKYGYISEHELAYWYRRPEYWLAVIRRALIRRGIASRSAVRLFRLAMQLTGGRKSCGMS